MNMAKESFSEVLAQGWKAFHRLSVHLALAVESCDDRGVVLLQLSDAVWRHLELSQLHQALSLRSHSEREHQDSLTLEWAVRDMEPVFFALLSSLGNRHSLWSRRYTLDGCEKQSLGSFKVIRFRRKDNAVEQVYQTEDSARALRLASAWHAVLANEEQDVKLLAKRRDGVVIDCPHRTSPRPRKARR